MLPGSLQGRPQLVEVGAIRSPDQPQPLNEDPQLFLEVDVVAEVPPAGLHPPHEERHDLRVGGKNLEGGGGGGGGGGVHHTCCCRLLVAGGPVEGRPRLHGV